MEALLNVLRIAFICLEVVLIFNLVIVVHEIGHFLAARWRGLVIERFGIWFGRPIWKKKINGVTYCLGWIPAGGYVALPQMASMETIEGKADESVAKMPPIKPLDKIIVALAGPVFSLGLAVVFAVLVSAIGKPVSKGEVSTVIGYVYPDMPAANAVCDDSSVSPGLKPGDKVLEVDGKPVSRFVGMNNSIIWRVVRSEGDTISFVVERDGKILRFESNFQKEERPFWTRKSLRQVGIEPEQQPMIAAITPDSPPALAGFKPNDVIMAVDGRPVWSELWLDDYLTEKAGQPVTATVRRGKEELQLPLPPMHPVIGGISEAKYSPAIAAGLKVNDTVLAVNGDPVYTSSALIKRTSASGGKPMQLTILRDGKEMQVQVQPALARVGENQMKGYKLGVSLMSDIRWDAVGVTTIIHPNPLHEIVGGVTTMVNTLTAVVSPKSDLKLQHLGGPVQITRVYYLFLESKEGWRRAFWFSILLNINLAILNLLPLPVLDGGHITLAIIEWMRRRPINPIILEKIQGSCALVLICFMLYVTFFDVGDLNIFRQKPVFEFEPPATAAPASSPS